MIDAYIILNNHLKLFLLTNLNKEYELTKKNKKIFVQKVILVNILINKKVKIIFLYQKTLIRTFHTSF